LPFSELVLSANLSFAFFWSFYFRDTTIVRIKVAHC